MICSLSVPLPFLSASSMQVGTLCLVHSWICLPFASHIGRIKYIAIEWMIELLIFFFCYWLIWALAYEKLYQFSSVTQSCPTLSNAMDCSTPGLPVHHQLPEFTQTHWVSDAIQPSHPLLSLSPPAFNLSEHQGLFKWVSSSHQVAKVLESASTSVLPMNIQYWFPLGWTGLISLKNSPWRIYAFKLWC